MKTSRKRKVSALRIGTVWLILLIALILLSLVAINVGSAGYSIPQILSVLFSSEKSTVKIVVVNLRLPRLILALLIGASLSASGAILQSVMRNPLADPGTIGVSAGAGTAATTILLLFPHLTNAVPIFAFGGAALACFLIYTMVPQLIQSHGIFEEDAEDVRRILLSADPHMTQAANISPLQYIYDELHPMLYLGHEYPMRLRKKGIAQVHTDMGGGMLGYEVTPYLIKQLLSSVEESKEIRKGGMPQ